MGSIITKIYDDYDAYRELCEILQLQPEAIDKFYDHQRQVLEKLGFSDIYDFFLNNRRREVRNTKIETILDKSWID